MYLLYHHQCIFSAQQQSVDSQSRVRGRVKNFYELFVLYVCNGSVVTLALHIMLLSTRVTVLCDCAV